MQIFCKALRGRKAHFYDRILFAERRHSSPICLYIRMTKISEWAMVRKYQRADPKVLRRENEVLQRTTDVAIRPEMPATRCSGLGRNLGKRIAGTNRLRMRYCPCAMFVRRRSMRKYFVSAGMIAAVGVSVAFISPKPAGAFVAHQDGLAKTATAANTVIEVKRSLSKGTPPGWHHGRKRGWTGNRPPRQR